MKRRAVLSAAPLLLSGCLGYTVEEKSDLEARRTRISELEAESEELRQQVEALETEASARDAELEDVRTARDEAETEAVDLGNRLDDTKRDHVAHLYELGEDQYLYGNGAWSNGVESWNAEDMNRAILYFRGAYSDYLTAEETFTEAAETASEYGIDADGAIETYREVNELMAEASFHMSNAALFVAEGGTQAASDRYDQAEYYREQANEIDVVRFDDLELEGP